MKTAYLDRVHPAVSFGFLLAAIAMSVVITHPVYLGVSILGALLLNISLLGAKALKKCLLFLPFALVVAAINPLFNTLGQTLLFSCFGRPYTLEALLYGAVVGGMLLSMLLWFSAYNAVLTDDKFTYLFGTLSPSLSLLLTTVFRMIPNLTRKLHQIMAARKCIGMAAGGTAKQTLRSGMTAISVLTSWALEGSITTADSMNSRGYGTGKRTSFHRYRFCAGDGVLTAVLALTWLYTVICAIHGGSAAEFIPAMQLAPVRPGMLAAYLIFLLTPTILNWKEDITWHILRSGS